MWLAEVEVGHDPQIINKSVENSNSTSGHLDLKNDVTLAREVAFRIKLLPVNALALVHLRNTCPSASYLMGKGQVDGFTSSRSSEDSRGSKSVDRGTFCDSAQIHVFVRAMRNGK